MRGTKPVRRLPDEPVTQCWTEREYALLANIYCSCFPLVEHYDRNRHHEDCPMRLPVDILLSIERLQ